MALTDEDLLDFDTKRFGGLERAPQRLLEEYGDAFRYQLIAARWIQQWADRPRSTRHLQPSNTTRGTCKHSGKSSHIFDKETSCQGARCTTRWSPTERL
jgi:hypothetical protein